MKSYLHLAWKELKAQKIMAVLILIAVILSCIMTTVIGNSLGILQTMRIEQAASLNGDRYATFHGLSETQAEALKQDDRLTKVGSLITAGYTELPESSLTLYFREYDATALSAYPAISKVKEGRLPAAPCEIALPENAIQLLGGNIHVGDMITLPAEITSTDGTLPIYSYSAELLVSGILENNYIGYTSGILDSIVGEGTSSELLPAEYLMYSTDFKVKNTAGFQATVNELAKQLSINESAIQYNWILLDALGIPYAAADTGTETEYSGFSFMTLACVLVGALVLFAAGLVIYNILKIAVTKRIREYGTLRAMGANRGQLYRLVSLQLLILCGIGIPVGLILGTLAAKGVLIAATGMLNPDLFMANSAEELGNTIAATENSNIVFLLISVAVTLIFAILAAFPAARYASHVSPTVAMSGHGLKVKRRTRKSRKIRNFEAYYARLNLTRSRGRTAITILSLVMSITVFVALQSFSSILDASNEVKEMHLGDYAITSEVVGISPGHLDLLREHEDVEHLSTTKLTVYTQDESGALPLELDFSLQTWEAIYAVGIDDARLTTLVEGLSEKDVEDLQSGVACIVKNPIPFSIGGEVAEGTTFHPGDEITVGSARMRVVGIVEQPITVGNAGFINGVQILASNTIYDQITGSTGFSEVYPSLTNDADPESFEAWLDEWCAASPGSYWLSYGESDAQLAESFAQINMLCWGLILFIGLIGILNIINTVYSNIHTRISEIGMQRAIGMSAKSLYKTFLWEGAYYGIFASILGGVLGYICTVFIGAATTNVIQLTAVPIFSIAAAAIFSIAACLLATAVPLHTISKMSIVESIENVE